jgi:hypothetical protein
MVTGTVLDTNGNDFTVDVRFEEPPPEPPDTYHDTHIPSHAEKEAYRASLGCKSYPSDRKSFGLVVAKGDRNGILRK